MVKVWKHSRLYAPEYLPYSASSNPGLIFFRIISEHGLLFEHGLLLFQPFFDREYTGTYKRWTILFAYNNVVPLLPKLPFRTTSMAWPRGLPRSSKAVVCVRHVAAYSDSWVTVRAWVTISSIISEHGLLFLQSSQNMGYYSSMGCYSRKYGI